MTKRILMLTALIWVLGFTPATGAAQWVINEVESRAKPAENRSRGLKMLKTVKKTLEEYYYDKNFKGIDIDQKFAAAADKIKTMDTNAQIFRVIAGVLIEFNDSHTRFYPPSRANRVEYGFTMQMIGDKCFVTDVKKDSSAQKLGMKLGDRIAKIGQYNVTRENQWMLNYFIYSLEPMPSLPVTVVDMDGKERSIVIEASFRTIEERKKEAEARRKEARENPYKCATISAAVKACKLLTFSVERKHIDKMMGEVVGAEKLILDLRGNRGGFVRINEYLTGHFFDREVKIAEMITRKKTFARIAKPVKNRNFKGELIVLTDSNSASASEVFARLIQIEKRGLVVGDLSAGAVMTSFNIPLQLDFGAPGFQSIVPFGMNVTVGDLIMSDGNRLEHVGVLPDRAVGPSAHALANKNDPVLAYAVELFGGALTAENAGKFSFLFKSSEDDNDDASDNDESADGDK